MGSLFLCRALRGPNLPTCCPTTCSNAKLWLLVAGGGCARLRLRQKESSRSEDFLPSPAALTHPNQTLELRNPLLGGVTLVANVCEELPDDAVPRIDGLELRGGEMSATESLERFLAESHAKVRFADCVGRLAVKGVSVRSNRERE
jgi:hypothetical protein